MPLTMAHFAEVIRTAEIQPQCILDVGAFDGEDTLLLKREFPSARCIAIEGDRDNFAALAMNPPRGVEVFHAVCSADGAPRSWFKAPQAPKIQGIYRHAQVPATEQRVQTVTLLDVCRHLALPVVDVMKLDVEGASYDVLVGFGARLHELQALHVETETGPWWPDAVKEDRVFDLLNQSGMRRVAQFSDQGQSDSIWLRT